MSNLDEQRILDALERVSQVEPAPEATAQAIERARQALATVSGRTRAKHRCWFIRLRTVKWLIPVAAAAVVVLAVIEFRPGGGGGHVGNGIVIADVVKQIRSARTAHIREINREASQDGVVQFVGDYYLKEPDKIRRDLTEPQDRAMSTRANGQRVVTLVPGRKLLYEVPRSELPKDAGELLAHFFSALEAKPEGKLPKSITADRGEDARLVFQSRETRDGRKLLKYLLDSPSTRTKQPSKSRALYWFDAADKKLAMMTREMLVNGAWVEIYASFVELDVDLSDDLFSTELPAGYSLASPVALAPGVTPEINDVVVKYEQARSSIQRYRLILWQPEDGGQRYRTAARCVCDGDRWRAEGVERLPVAIESEFDEVWRRLVVGQYSNTGLTYLGRPATIRRLPDGLRSDWGEDPNLSRYRLADLGWPELPGGRSFSGADSGMVYQRLPGRPDRPGLIGIRAETDDAQATTHRMEVFWIDPAKDYLCIRHEEHQRKGQPWKGSLNWQPTEPEVAERPNGSAGEFDRVREIVICEQDPMTSGRWCPKAFEYADAWVINGKRYRFPPRTDRIRVDATKPIPQDLLEWPADVPKPKQE